MEGGLLEGMVILFLCKWWGDSEGSEKFGPLLIFQEEFWSVS